LELRCGGTRAAGPDAKIVVDRRGDGRGRGRLADAVAALVAEATGGGDFAEVASLSPSDGLTETGAGANLGAGLGDAAGFLRGGDQLAPFPDVVGNGFLDVDILAGLKCPDAHERVPVVGRRDRDGIEVGRGEQLADVGKFFTVTPSFARLAAVRSSTAVSTSQIATTRTRAILTRLAR